MNETMDILLNRTSVRSFKEDKIEEDIVNSILDAGIHAATAGNLQPFSIIQIQEKENSAWFVDNGLQRFIGKAPLNLLFCLDFHRLKRWSEDHYAPFVMDKSFRHFWVGFQDVIIAAQSIETAANSYGIGSVYIGTTIELIPQIQEKFKLPKGVVPIVLLTMGYPKSKRTVARKLSRDILVHKEEYQTHSIDVINNAYFEKYGPLQTSLSSELKEKILAVVEEVEGAERKQVVQQYLDTQDKVSMPMRYFGLHYVANYMAKGNTELLDVLHDNGFIWANRDNHPK